MIMTTKSLAFRSCIAAVLTGMLVSAFPTAAFGQDEHRPATKSPSRIVPPATNPAPRQKRQANEASEEFGVLLKDTKVMVQEKRR
jgi:hypothetical protein